MRMPLPSQKHGPEQNKEIPTKQGKEDQGKSPMQFHKGRCIVGTKSERFFQPQLQFGLTISLRSVVGMISNSRPTQRMEIAAIFAICDCGPQKSLAISETLHCDLRGAMESR